MADLSQHFGAFFDEASVSEWLDVPKGILAKRVEENQMIGCMTGDGHWLYPTFQFTDAGDIVRGVPEVLRVLLEQQEPWAAARWFVVPSPDLTGKVSAIDWLAQGGDPAPVVAEARRDAARLSR